MTRIEKTRGIVLRSAPYSETSRVVTWLTPDHGRLATILKGAQRPRSEYLGHVDLFYTCELVFYARDPEGVHITREVAPEKTRDRFRSDWRSAAAASYATDLVARIAPPGAPHPGLFELLDRALDTLAESGVSPAFLNWFELKLLAVMGLAPRLTNCMACGKALAPGEDRAGFSTARGGLLCQACVRRGEPSAPPIPPDVLATLLGWQRSRSPRAALSTRTSALQRQAIEEVLGRFLRHHLDLPLPSRDIALDLMQRRFA